MSENEQQVKSPRTQKLQNKAWKVRAELYTELFDGLKAQVRVGPGSDWPLDGEASAEVRRGSLNFKILTRV